MNMLTFDDKHQSIIVSPDCFSTRMRNLLRAYIIKKFKIRLKYKKKLSRRNARFSRAIQRKGKKKKCF